MDACGPGRQASPPRRPAAGPAAATPGNGEGAHEVTARDHPAPAPAGLPLRQGRAARRHPPRRAGRPRGLRLPFPCRQPRAAAPPPARRGPDLTRRAERSVRRRGPTDGPPPGTPTAPGRPAATPGAGPGTADDPLLTIEEVTAELRVSRAAFYRWRRQGAGPAAVRLPGGGVRVRRSALTLWLRRLETGHARRTGADRWTVTTSGSGTPGRSPTTPAAARYRVRWAVDGQEHCKSFRNKTLADGFLDDLKDAARDRRPFSPRTGLPAAETDRGGDGHLVRARPRLRRGEVAEPGPGLPPVGRRGAGHRDRRPDRARRRARPSPGCCAGRCSPGRSTPPPARPTRRARSPSPWAGPPAPRCRSARWTTRPRCGSRSARAPRP